MAEAMTAAGLEPENTLIADGKLHRIHDRQDKPGKKNLWYILFEDGTPAGSFGHWSRLPDGQTWQAKADNTLTPTERKQIKERMERARAARDLALQEVRTECRAWCAEKYQSAPTAPADHPYLVKKQIPPGELRLFRTRGDAGALMVPVKSSDGTIHGMQFISPDGSKKFKTGTVKAGNCYRIGKIKDDTVVICEGYATGASIHQSTGHAVLVAFDAGNLKSVAELIRPKRPDMKIIIAADDDHATAGNPGLTKATEAALAVNGLLAVPTFSDTRGPKDTDFNDLARLARPEAVKACLEAAAIPTPAPALATEKPSETNLESVEHEIWPEPIDLLKLSQTSPKAPSFIMQEWLPCGYATLFAGHGGVGKSALALALAVCLAMGHPFFGLPVERRRILYLSCEDREGVLHWRLSRICAFLEISIGDLAGWLHILDLVGHDAILYQPGRDGVPTTGAYRQLAGNMKALGAQVLIVDGISDTYDGNENARAEVKAYINALLALIPPEDGAVILVGHVAKPVANTASREGYSGSTGWHNSVRARWYLYPLTIMGEDSRLEPTGDLHLELQKSNLGPTDKTMRFSWNDAAGMFTGNVQENESNFDRKYRDREEQDGIMAALIAAAATDYVPAAKTGPRTTLHVLSVQPDFPKTIGLSKADKKRFWRHIEELRRIGRVKESSNTREDRHKVITLVPTDEARSGCGHAGNDEKDITRTLPQSPLAGMRAMPQGGYIGGDIIHTANGEASHHDQSEGQLDLSDCDPAGVCQ